MPRKKNGIPFVLQPRPTKGADGKPYVTVLDENDRVLVQPILANYIYQNWISERRFVVDNDKCAYVYDDNGNMLFCGRDYSDGTNYIGTFHSGRAKVGSMGLINLDGEMTFYGLPDMSHAVKLRLGQ